MGTWNTEINENDTFLDIYSNFFERYNAGDNPETISIAILNDFREMFDDIDDKNNSLFGLALAQWETKSLNPTVFNQVKQIVESGNDLEVWRGLVTDEKTIRERQIVLNKFLALLKTEREKPKRRVRTKFNFFNNELVKATSPDNKKIFTVSEEFTNSKYIHTSGLMMWENGGGSVLYFTGQGQNISAKWIDRQTLEIAHDKNIDFSMKKESAYYRGDEVKITYVTK